MSECLYKAWLLGDEACPAASSNGDAGVPSLSSRVLPYRTHAQPTVQAVYVKKGAIFFKSSQAAATTQVNSESVTGQFVVCTLSSSSSSNGIGACPTVLTGVGPVCSSTIICSSCQSLL